MITNSFEEDKAHILSRIRETSSDTEPFAHLYVEGILPQALYEDLDNKARELGGSNLLQPRQQDSRAFVNNRYSFREESEGPVERLYRLFSDMDVKAALLGKFYQGALGPLAKSVSIHRDEFEFTFTERGRFQNIHVDIPAKYLSLVFYFPDGVLTEEEEAQNGTVLYDKALAAKRCAPFRQNSVCVFAPHFFTYHGFSSTIDRTALVLFYVNAGELWWSKLMGKVRKEHPPFAAFKDRLQKKLLSHPLIEYGGDADKVLLERHETLINAPLGRVMIDT